MTPLRPLLGRSGRQFHKRGTALLLSILVLFVVITIVFQISIGSMTDARIARNDVRLTTMDLAIESAVFDVLEQLRSDGEAAQDGAADPTDPAAGMGAAAASGGDPQAGMGGETDGEPAASDSHEDEWGRPQRHDINEVDMRILVQDEDSKVNVLNMLNADEEVADEAFQRVVRVLDLCREGTLEDINGRDAEDMAETMRDHMLERDRSLLPRPELLTDDEENENLGLPLSLREFLTLMHFEERHFRDYRDEDGTPVHSIGSFLTVFSSPATLSSAPTQSGSPQAGGAGALSAASGEVTTATASGDGAMGADGGEGAGAAAAAASGAGGAGGGSGSESTPASAGFGVNLNTAPPAVLKALLDDRDVSSRFWDEVIEYRNLEEEDEYDEEEDDEPFYDEYGEEIIQRQVFDTLDELGELRGWEDQDVEVQEMIKDLLTTQSNVFSIYITARIETGVERFEEQAMTASEAARMEEQSGGALVRTVRMIVWRRTGGEEIELLPIIPWEILDYVPLEVLDFPDEER
ncbi:MAG: hypothetical protein CMJ84_00800 [Planctomycetes bacterium]|jgi:hypothetical protein|nr:hypothetical protein [Planctomycetota bacterium]MDP6408719.1 hypothetical protein [Planctomycetota bacterium]